MKGSTGSSFSARAPATVAASIMPGYTWADPKSSAVASEAPTVVSLMAEGRWQPLVSYGFRNCWLLGSYLILLLSRRRWLDIAAAGSVILFYTFNYIILRNDALLALVSGG